MLHRGFAVTSSITLDCNCALGEGLFVSEELVAWVDIASNEIFTYRDGELRSHVLPIKATVILDRLNDSILLGSGTGLGGFDLSSEEYSSCQSFGSVFRSDTHRTNDGCRLRQGGYLIGTMHRVAPSENLGAIYFIEPNGRASELDTTIYIPNSFVELDDGSVLISDSRLGVIYRYYFSASAELVERTVWYNAEQGIAPDGGCSLPDGNIAIAMWDAGCIRVFDQSGTVVRDIPVAAKRPTNCKYDFRSQGLWVTSALEGLDASELRQYPRSGKTFCIPVSADSA